MGRIANVLAELLLDADVVTKDLLRRYESNDFIPDGEWVDLDELTFRPTGRHELFQCCERTGEDIQSGPYYCGKIAEVVAGNRRKYVGLCEDHARRCSKRQRYATPQAKDSLIR